MSKYEPLSRYLAEQQTNEITLTFSKISEILGADLPQSAYDHRPWWANRYDGRDAHNSGWQSVGWESSGVALDEETVVFTRTIKTRADFSSVPFNKPLTIEEAKRGLAAHFQVEPNDIKIIVSA